MTCTHLPTPQCLYLKIPGSDSWVIPLSVFSVHRQSNNRVNTFFSQSLNDISRDKVSKYQLSAVTGLGEALSKD